MFRSIRQHLWLYILLFCILVTISNLIYFLNFMRNNFENNLSHKHCLSELESFKFQLNVVTEYKNRLDKLLTDTQRKLNLEKEKHKDIMDSCLAMKQQSAICQSQFEELQLECKKAKINLDNFKKGALI